MNALHRLSSRLRAWRIDRLRARIAGAERMVSTLERRQRRALTMLTERTMIGRPMATRTRPPVPAFLRRAS